MQEGLVVTFQDAEKRTAFCSLSKEALYAPNLFKSPNATYKLVCPYPLPIARGLLDIGLAATWP